MKSPLQYQPGNPGGPGDWNALQSPPFPSVVHNVRKQAESDSSSTGGHKNPLHVLASKLHELCAYSPSATRDRTPTASPSGERSRESEDTDTAPAEIEVVGAEWSRHMSAILEREEAVRAAEEAFAEREQNVEQREYDLFEKAQAFHEQETRLEQREEDIDQLRNDSAPNTAANGESDAAPGETASPICSTGDSRSIQNELEKCQNVLAGLAERKRDLTKQEAALTDREKTLLEYDTLLDARERRGVVDENVPFEAT